MDSSQEQRSEKGPKTPLEDASRADLVKQVKRQLALLQKAKAKCDDLNQKCLEKDKALTELHGQAQKWEQDAQKWKQDQAELETLRQAYQSLQGAQEKQFESFRVLEEQLATSNEDLVRWRHKYTECLMSLECTESKMASYTQGTEFLQQELRRLEAENRVANAKVSELSESQRQLQAERAALQQQLDEQDRRHEAGSEAALSQGHMKHKIEELLSQCSSLKQERDTCSAAREVLAQQAENAIEEADSLRHKISVLLQERSSLENQRDEKMNECNLLQEEKHGLERQVSDLYQVKEELEAKEKEFAKILDDNSNMEKLLTEAVNENTQLHESVNGLREEVSRAEAEKQELAHKLNAATDSLLEQTQSSDRLIAELEQRLVQQMEKQKELEHQLAVSVSQQIESEKLINNLKALLAQQPGSAEDSAMGVRIQELLHDQAALKEQLKVMKQEKEYLFFTNVQLQEVTMKLEAHKAHLIEELDAVKTADADLLEKLQTSAGKVSALEKDLNDSLHEKQDMIDELTQVKDLQCFLEDEAKELHLECEKLNMETARLEADLENDRLHIQKLEIELEAAECRDQQSLRELEALRQKLKEMALLAMKYEEAFRDCTVMNAESRMPIVLKAFHKLCQLILETAERNVVDIQVEGLLPGMGAMLVLNDCSGDCDELWGEPVQNKEGSVSVEAYESLKNEIETIREQLLASTKSVDLLQFEKQALEEDLGFEKRGRDLMSRELEACEELVRSQERRIEELQSGLDARFSDLRDCIEQKEEMLKERGVALKGALQSLAEVSEGYTELRNEHVTLLERMHQLEDISSATAVETAAHGHVKQLGSLDCTNDFKPTERERDMPENPRSDGLLAGQNVLDETCEHSVVDQHEVAMQSEAEKLFDANSYVSEECSSLGESLESSKATIGKLVSNLTELYGEMQHLEANGCHSEACSSLRSSLWSSEATIEKLNSNLNSLYEEKQLLQESMSHEVSMLKAELKERTRLLDQIHSRLDDQLEQYEMLEAMLADRNNAVQSYQDEVAKKDSELATLTQELSHLNDQLASYEKEHSRLCTVFQPQARNEDNLQDDALREWYSAHRAVLNLLSQLVAHASKQRHLRISSDGDGDSSVLSEAECLCATLSKKLEFVISQEASSSLSCVITKAVCSDVTAELALVKSLGQLLDSFSADGAKACGEVPPSELEEEKQNSSMQIASLQNSLQEKEERLAKFKALVMKLKKELADKTKQMNSIEKDLSGMKQELEKNMQASKQSVLNFQSLQNEYDNLQDQHESTRSLCKELEGKLTTVMSELAAAKLEISSACAEKDKMKQTNDVLSAELKAWDQCKIELESKLASVESQAGLAKEREERFLAQIKALEGEVREANKQLLAEREEHANTSAQLEKKQKESKMHTLLDLEIADYERTVAELNNLLKEKNEELDNTRKESLAYQSKITSLVEHIGYLESQKKADDERMLAFKETVATLKEGLSKSRKHEEDLLQSEVRLESELKAAQLREQDLKLGYAEVSRKCQELESTFRTTKENYQRAIKALESKVASLKEELGTSQAELQVTKVEFENYKVRVHTVLKQQKKSTAGVENADAPEAQEKLQGAMEQMRQKIRDLTEQVELSQSEAEASRDEYDRLAQRHQAIALELEAREAQWKRRLEDVIKQNSADMSVELDRQLQKQYEELSAKYQKLAIQEQQHSRALELHLETVEQLKREIAELQQRLPTRQGSPSHDEAPPIDITTLERQDGEGSESISPVPPVMAKPSPWSLVPTGGFKPLEQLLHEDEDLVVAEDLDALHAKINDSQKKVDHLAELLNESESSNLRMTEQIRVLKEEIRRLERNQEREKHAQNLEYLKNVIMKFVTLRGGSEKERLVPVLTTMLKLSPDEKKDLDAVVTGEVQQDAAAASSWGGYLPRW